MKAWTRKSAAHALFGGGPKQNKYRAVRTPCGAGHMHDSKREAGRCDELRLLERGGQIRHLQQQPEFPIDINQQRVCIYRADFSYFENNQFVVEDAKGFKTPEYRLKKKLVEALHPGVRIREV